MPGDERVSLASLIELFKDRPYPVPSGWAQAPWGL